MRGYDIIIVGSSFIGITTAIMLAKLERIRVAIVTNDADVISMLKDNTYNFNRSSASTNASKLLAIANSSYELLKECGVGDALQKNSQKINHIRVVDDDSYAKVDFAPHDIGVDCFGYMIDERVLKAVLCEKFYKLLSENTNFHVFQSDQIASIRANTYNVSLNSTLVNVVENEACSTLQAQLIVGCDGRNSIVRNLSYIGTNIKDYDQTAIVVDISHQNWPHDGVAVEKFTPAGPFAVLPKHDNDGTQSSLVWIERGNIKSDDLNKLGATAISDLIRKKLAGYLGDIDVISEPSAHQLKLVQAKQRYAKRVVLLGDAAQSIHPVAGQGVNLGLRDVKSFISIVQQHHSIGLDVGAADVLKEYATSRELDVQTMIFATTSLVKLFSNDFLPLKILRRCGLKLFDKLDYLKKHAMLYAVGCKN